MTPNKDTELDALSDARERASTLRTEWHEYLDSCHEQLSALHDQNDSRIDWLSNEGDDLYQQMGDAVARSKECYSSGDHGGAGEWSARGKALKAQLTAVNDEKNGLIAQMKEAQATFNGARDDYRDAKAAHEAAQQAFDRRLAEVGARQAAKATARAEHIASGQSDAIDRDTREAIKRASEFTQFEDDDIRVEFEEGFDKDHQCSVNSIYIFHRDPTVDDHVHAIFRVDTGEELLCEYHPDSRRR